MASKPGIRIYFQKEPRQDSGHPHARYGSAWISPSKSERLPQFPEMARIELEEAEPPEGYDRYIRVHGTRSEPIHLRRSESGQWEVHGGAAAYLKANGNELADYRWHPWDTQVISGHPYSLPYSIHGDGSYSFHAELDPNPVQRQPPAAIANRLMHLNVEPKDYRALVIVPGAKIQVQKDDQKQVVRDKNGKINLHLSELLKLRVREGLRKLVRMHLDGVPASLAFSGGKLHYYEREPAAGMSADDIRGKTEAGLMQEYMADVLSNPAEFKTWLDETPEEQRAFLPRTPKELIRLLGGDIRQMSYSETFSQDGLGNALGVRMHVVEPRDGRGQTRYTPEPERGEFRNLDQVHLVIEEPFKARFLRHVRDEFPKQAVEASVPPINEKVDSLLLNAYKSEYLKAMTEQGQEYIRANAGKSSAERVRWLAKNHPMYAHLRPKPQTIDPARQDHFIAPLLDLVEVATALGSMVRTGWRWGLSRFRRRAGPAEKKPPQDRPPAQE